DSRFLGLFSDGKLKIIDLLGGSLVTVADAPNYWGATWSRDGTLLFASPDFKKGLYRVASTGGMPAPVLEMDSSKHSSYESPRFLPDGKHFLYSANGPFPQFRGTCFASLDGKENRLLSKYGVYASGFLLYLPDSTLMAQTFDPERGQLKGDPHPVAERVT